MQNGVEKDRVRFDSLVLHPPQQLDGGLQISRACKTFDENRETDQVGSYIVAGHVTKELHSSLQVARPYQSVDQSVVRHSSEAEGTMGLVVELDGYGQLVVLHGSLDCKGEGHGGPGKATEEAPGLLEDLQRRFHIRAGKARVNHTHEGILCEHLVIGKQLVPQSPGLSQAPSMAMSSHEHHASMRRRGEVRGVPASQQLWETVGLLEADADVQQAVEQYLIENDPAFGHQRHNLIQSPRGGCVPEACCQDRTCEGIRLETSLLHLLHQLPSHSRAVLRGLDKRIVCHHIRLNTLRFHVLKCVLHIRVRV
mmetsp:Transcript_43899/g.102598  ORF Transcript_43899/g.102598 Transcript_43899/m.102598 type:complete len:310 (+) Transcript_43899:663-1592(+)